MLFSIHITIFKCVKRYRDKTATYVKTYHIMNDNNEVDEYKDSIYNSIDDLIGEYQNDSYMKSKLQSYICNQLPNVLEHLKQNHEQRVERIVELTAEQDVFIQKFMNENLYYYISATDNYFVYNNLQYQAISEDDILHHILSTISKGRNLMSWKQKTRMNIMKRIRENSLIKTIPETETIQSVIESLYPALFSTKNETKYFLTILGDNILRKNTNLIHYIHPVANTFLRDLNNICQFLMGVQLSQTFKNKYYDHNYSDCRLLNINDNIQQEHVRNYLINNMALDIMGVACHYSARYGSSDEYILNSSNLSLNNSVLYLKNTSPTSLVLNFITDYIDISQENQLIDTTDNNRSTMRTPYISWNNMQYLWRHYLNRKELPPIMFLQTFKTIVTDKLRTYYIEDQDLFKGICCKYMPSIEKFLSFWEETVTIDETESDMEIDEVVTLFRKWCVLNNDTFPNLSDKQIIDLISYYFPSIEIDRDKYIAGIRCSLWDKHTDIQTALNSLKEILREKHTTTNRASSPSSIYDISIYDTYIYYCKMYSNNRQDKNDKLIVSKNYFEKYVLENMMDYIVDEKYISMDWYLI